MDALGDLRDRLRDGDRYVLSLASLFLIGAFLRIFRLGDRPLWADEAVYSIAARRMMEASALVPRYPTSNAVITGHPPLSFYILGVVQKIGTEEWLLRAPSAVFGAITVLAVYFLGKEMYGRNTGIVAALFLAVSPVHVLYSREVHPTAIALFFLTVSAYYVFAVMDRPGIRNIGLSVVSLLAAALSNFMSFAILALFIPLAAIRRGRKWVRSYSAYILATLFVLALVLNVWMLKNSVPPKTINPFESELTGVTNPISLVAALAEFIGYFVRWAVRTPVAEFVGFWKKMLSFYFGRITGYLTLPLFLLPALGLLRRTGWDSEDVGSLALYAWFAGIFVLLGIFVFAMYYRQGLSPIRGHPAFLIPFILLVAAGTMRLWGFERRWVRVIPVVFVILSLTHTLPVTANVPMYLDVTDAPVSQFRNDTFFDADPAEGKIWLETNYSAENYYTFEKSNTIVCGDNPLGAWFLCYPDHPAGYSDSIDWRAATDFVLSRAEPGSKYFVSVAPPFMYYSGDDEDMDITGLQCNPGHRFCNVMETVQSPGVPVWIVADEERYTWQLNADEKVYIENSCEGWEQGNVKIFRCV